MPSISLWQQSGPLSDHTTDAAVIGAGIAGLSAAIALEQAGLDVTVVEARAPAASASGRNAGFLMRGAADNYTAAANQYGRNTAAQLWRWTEDNLTDLKALGLESLPSYAARPSCLLALTDSEADELTTSADLLTKDGFDAQLLTPDSPDANDTIFTHAKPRLALVNPHDAVINPVELVGLLCSKLQRTQLYTGCAAAAIHRHDDTTLHLHTTLGTISAKRILIATNALGPALIPSLAPLVQPNRGQMLAIRCPGVRLDRAYYANHGSEYLRQLDDQHVIIGGARLTDEQTERTSSESTSDTIQSRLESIAKQWLFPESTDPQIVARWAGTMAFSPDHLPIAGPVTLPGKHAPDPDLWFTGAFTGHGMSMGHRTATAAARSMIDGSDLPPWLRLDRFQTAIPTN